MNTVKHVEKMWRELQATIDKTTNESADHAVLSGYRERSYEHALENLLRDEVQNERQHRSGFGSGSYPFSAVVAAKIIIIENVARGAQHVELLPARLWLEIRRSAAEAMTIGNLLGTMLPIEWRSAAEALDYSELMNPK